MRIASIAMALALCLASPTMSSAQSAGPSTQCLNGRAVVQVTGDHYTRFAVRYGPNQGADARDARFFISSARGRSGVWMYGSPPGVCWAGGSVSSDFSLLASWRDLKNKNHAAIGWQHRDFHLYGFYAFNVHDGIRSRVRDYFQVHHSWLEYVRDDCIENDRLANALIHDSLFDGCNAFISTRPAGSDNGSSTMIVLDQVLARLEPMPHPNNPERRRSGSSARVDGVLYSHGNFFKTYSNGPQFTIRNSIFLAQLSGPNKASLSFPNVADCSNNVIVWLGSGPYPGTYPTHCFRVTTDHEEWKAAVRSRHARHPDVGVGQKPPSAEMGSVEIGRS